MVSKADGREVIVAKGDTQRQVLNQGAVAAIRDKPLRSLLGAGIYGFWPVAGPYVNEVRRAHGVPQDLHRAAGGNEPPRPPALPAFIVEAGIVGMLLFVVNSLWPLGRALSAMKRAGAPHGRPLLLFIATVPILALWAVFVEIQDIVVAYLLLMPYGLLDGWTSGVESTA
jgi:O-antigen ligase